MNYNPDLEQTVRLTEKAADTVQATARLPAGDTRVRTRVPAAVCVPDLKAVSFRYTDNSLRGDSTTALQRNMQ